MKELNEDRFSLHFENTSKGSFFVVSMATEEEIQELQVEQLNNNSFPGILKCNVQYKNNITYIYYNITSKIGLEQFLNKRKLKKNEFINIIQSISKTLIKSQNFLIYDKNFVIDKRYIYINSSTQEIFLTYLPICIGTDIIADYKDFVMDLIMRTADIDESGSDNYLQRILTNLKSDNFNIESFNNLLCEIKLLKVINFEENKSHKDVEVNEIRMNANKKFSEKEEFLFNKRSSRNKQAGLKNNRYPGNNQIGSQDEKSFIKKQSKRQEEKLLRSNHQNEKSSWNNQNKLHYKMSSYIIAIIVQISIFSLIIIGIIFGVFNKLGNPISTYLGLTIIIFGGEYFLFRRLFNKKNWKIVREIQSETIKKTINQAANHPDNQNNGNVSQQIKCDNRDGFDNFNDTVFLDYGTYKGALLKGLKNDKVEEIKIVKDRFIIGRLKPLVDFALESKFIGKVHCEITFHDENYFIKDINSQNGTFINSLRIDSNKEYIIKNGDKILFADCEYLFFDQEVKVEQVEVLA